MTTSSFPDVAIPGARAPTVDEQAVAPLVRRMGEMLATVRISAIDDDLTRAAARRITKEAARLATRAGSATGGTGDARPTTREVQ